MKEEYTLTIYTEDQIGLISKIAIIFSRRKISMQSLNISSSEIDKMYRFTIVVKESYEIAKNLVLQIEKIIDVFRCYCHTDREIIWKQMALCKVPTSITMNEENISFIIRRYNAKAIGVQKDYTIFEITGNEIEINNFLAELDQYGLVEFIKSSRIAIIKSSQGFGKELSETE